MPVPVLANSYNLIAAWKANFCNLYSDNSFMYMITGLDLLLFLQANIVERHLIRLTYTIFSVSKVTHNHIIIVTSLDMYLVFHSAHNLWITLSLAICNIVNQCIKPKNDKLLPQLTCSKPPVYDGYHSCWH